MEKILLPAVVSLSVFFCSMRGVSASPRPRRIFVLATGGTIAGEAASPSEIIDYRAGVLGVDALLDAAPEICNFAEARGEQLCNIDSKDMTDEIWRRLALRVNELLASDEADGIVIAHGTDTMEETALFLSLTVESEKPVVLTGAMRPATAENADGPRNLLDAVRVAASQEAEGKGVLVVMDGVIHDARDVEKTHTTSVAAFASREAGPLGRVGENGVIFDRVTSRNGRLKFSAGAPLPRVDVLYGFEGDDGALARASLQVGAKGIVYAGLGNGSIPAPVEKILARAADEGVIVVRASRVSGGAVVSSGSTKFLDSGSLNPQKARVLLRLALTKTNDAEEIRQMFRDY